MFEREIKFIYDFNLNKVNKLGPYFTFEQLQSVDLHPAILHYISAEIDYLVFEDRQKLLKNSVFDYSGEKISYHFNEITEELKKIKRFSLEYVAKLILHSTSFTVNFLVRPKWTLTRFIFDEAQHKTSNEIKQILNYIHYYGFLKKIIISYINSKKILSMNVSEFEELLNKADKLGVETNLKGIFSHSFISMAEFFNIGQMQKTRIPLTAVELFLEEKDLPHHLQKLEDTFGNDENARFNIGDYMKVLTAVMITTKEEEPEQDQLILFDEQKEPEIETIQNDDEKETEGLDYIKEEESFENQSEIVEQDIAEAEIEAMSFAKEEISNVVDENETITNEDEDLLSKWNSGEYIEAGYDKLTDEKETDDDVKTEIISSIDEEVTIKPHAKIRIKVNENNRIEPISEEELLKEDVVPPLNQDSDDDDVDSYSSIIKEENLEEQFEESNEAEFSSNDTLIENTEQEIEDALSVETNEMFGEQEVNEIEDVKLPVEEEPETFDNLLQDYIEPEDELKEESKTEQAKLDLAEVLEHKNMTKIIEVIFDYDIEDFANMLDEISNSRNVEDAHFIVNETLSNRRINQNSKEAEALRDIITEYFNRK